MTKPKTKSIKVVKATLSYSQKVELLSYALAKRLVENIGTFNSDVVKALNTITPAKKQRERE